MAKIPDSILKKINRYIGLLEKNNLHIKAAYLFGSYAKGKHNEWSDIDIALVSDNFRGFRFKDIERIRKYKFLIDDSISPLPYRTEDFTDEDLFVREIKKTGIRVI